DMAANTHATAEAMSQPPPFDSPPQGYADCSRARRCSTTASSTQKATSGTSMPLMPQSVMMPLVPHMSAAMAQAAGSSRGAMRGAKASSSDVLPANSMPSVFAVSGSGAPKKLKMPSSSTQR